MKTRPAVRALLTLGLLAAAIAGPADARRSGSFGSRGSRTYYAPSATRLAPSTAPVSRSMTARSEGETGYRSPSYAPSYRGDAYPTARPRFGFGGGLLTGLVAGGLLGSLFGHGGGWGGGYGAGGGGLAWLIQLAVLAGIVWLVFRLFRGRNAAPQPAYRDDRGFGAGPFGKAAQPAYTPPPAPASDDIALTPADQDQFERLLIELQDAFGHEDYARLRAITTPEVMSYLAEELSDNATHNRRNEVSGTRLIDGEVSEAWAENGAEYATVALRYESVDVMRDRASGAILGGDTRPTETTELWTFTRPARAATAAWKVSAIQES